MVTERQVQEMVAGWVSCLVFYVNSGKTRDVKGAMIAEIQATATLVKSWGLSDKAGADLLLRPVQAELVVRYGSAEGRELFKEFAEAFNGLTGSVPVLAPVRI